MPTFTYEAFLDNNNNPYNFTEYYFTSQEQSEYVKIWTDFFQYGVTLLFSLIGIVSNPLMILVLYKMGYNDTTNITMTAIAIFDLLRCVCELLMLCLVIMVVFIAPSATITPQRFDISYLLDVFLNCLRDDVSTGSIVLIAYVTLQRCLCVSHPFMVKNIFTRRSVSWTVGGLSVGIILLSRTGFYPIWLGMILSFQGYNSNHNIPKVNLVFSDNNNSSGFNVTNLNVPHLPELLPVNNVLFNAHYLESRIKLISAILTVISFVICVVCVVIIYYHLLKASRTASRLQQASIIGDGVNQSKSLSMRDKKIIKMLVIIASFYVIAYAPRLWSIYTSFYKMIGDESVYFLFVYILLPIDEIVLPLVSFEVVNSAINFFIFYTMSAKFKRELRQLICSQ